MPLIPVPDEEALVARSQVLTRVATADDIPVMLELWDELRQVGGRGERANNPVTAVEVRDRLKQVVDNSSYRVVMAYLEDKPAGMIVLQATRPDPFTDARVVNVAHLVVANNTRHKGVGHALLTAAADFATERRLDQVSVSVYPSLRDASRFFARLGFAPAATRRVAPVSVLRRRLGSEPATADALRRRSRLIRPIPAQPARRKATDDAEAAPAPARRRATAR
ncbi:MAG TPA: GNAT family N-acetyltransferase [Mycobacteriales bacterium]|nr:GNAT family N-acetyltransferase [Mycobacteriales bacterium]